MLELDGNALVPVGPPGFTQDVDAATVRLFGGVLYTAVHYFGADGLEFARRE